MGEVVRVGFYSPMPPARTGVADYAAALLGELRRHGRVDVAPPTCDVALYHLGNNDQHAEIYRRALERPGVVVLHDAVLHHFLLGQLDESSYIEEFVYNYGEWNRGLARDLWHGRAASGSDPRYFCYPMLRRAVEGALAVVIHNPAAALAVAQHAAGALVVEIPHLFQALALPSPGQVERYRQKLGVAPATRLFGVFGYLRESKRLMTILQAFEQVHRELPGTALLVAGQFASSDLARAAEPLLANPGVIRLPYLKESEFWLAASAVDAAINLRYPAAGESSGIAIRLMGLGKPVMMTDGPEAARYPEGSCIRIPAGVAEADALREHMVLLTLMVEVLRAIGLRAANYIQEHHRVDRIGNRFWDLLSEYCT
jgi:glycosyltransferase involved in cell wall biosynthesis